MPTPNQLIRNGGSGSSGGGGTTEVTVNAPAGPAGPAGVPGPAGPAGPAGSGVQSGVAIIDFGIENSYASVTVALAGGLATTPITVVPTVSTLATISADEARIEQFSLGVEPAAGSFTIQAAPLLGNAVGKLAVAWMAGI